MADRLIGIIGGSGLGDALAQHITGPSKETLDTPFGDPSSPVLMGTIGAKKIAFITRHGPGHTLSPTEVPYAANIFALKTLGATTLIASGAVGSLQEQIAPKDLVLVDQIVHLVRIVLVVKKQPRAAQVTYIGVTTGANSSIFSTISPFTKW